MIYYYRFYDLNQQLPFGKYKGRTLEEVARVNSSYIIWCASHITGFILKEQTIKGISEIDENFKLTERAKKAIRNNFDYWYSCYKEEKVSEGRWYDVSAVGMDDEGAVGYDGDTIKNAFEGDSTNYWNID